MIALALLSLVASFDADGFARAAARAAANDVRFDVLAEVEVVDAVDIASQRQACGVSESCAAQLAGALDARYVLFARANTGTPTDLRIALTLTDVKTATVLARAELRGDDAAVDAGIAPAVARLLAPVAVDAAAGAKTRLFVARVAEVTSAPPTASTSTPPPPTGPNFALLGAGGGAAVLGAGAALVGGFVVLPPAQQTLADKTSLGSEKETARSGEALGWGLVGAGAAVVVAGAVVGVLGVVD